MSCVLQICCSEFEDSEAETEKMIYLRSLCFKIISDTWSAAGLSEITSAASLSARLAFCSPSAAITWLLGPYKLRSSRHIRHLSPGYSVLVSIIHSLTLALASRAASASAAMALCNCSGTLTWLLFQILTLKLLTLNVPDVLDLNSLDHHSPRLCSLIQNRLGEEKVK